MKRVLGMKLSVKMGEILEKLSLITTDLEMIASNNRYHFIFHLTLSRFSTNIGWELWYHLTKEQLFSRTSLTDLINFQLLIISSTMSNSKNFLQGNVKLQNFAN
jgi:hypothetical protein